MRAGELRHRIVLQRNTGTTRNEFGEVVDVWSDLATVWARISPLTGREIFTTAQQFAAEVTHAIELRYYPNLSPKDRIQFGSRLFNIQRVVSPEERKVHTLIYATEVVP